MPFDLRPLWQALLALWSFTQTVTSYQGNLLDIASLYLSRPLIYALFFLAGLSETYGTRAVTLFLNRLGRRPFVLVLLLTALTYVVGGIVWTFSIAGVLGVVYPDAAAAPRVIVVAVLIGYIPLLFAFLAVIPYLGPAILYLLQGLSLLATTVAISVGFGLPFTQAAISTAGGWLIFQLLRWFTAGPLTLMSRLVLRLVTGREVDYSLRNVAPTVPLGLQRYRRTLGDEGEG